MKLAGEWAVPSVVALDYKTVDPSAALKVALKVGRMVLTTDYQKAVTTVGTKVGHWVGLWGVMMVGLWGNETYLDQRRSEKRWWAGRELPSIF